MVLSTLTAAPSDSVDTLHAVAWDDPLVDSVGVDPRSLYVETFWLPVLGPSSTWLLRRLVDRLEDEPGGFDLDPDETARSLGLGGAGGRHSPFNRALSRCIRFAIVRATDEGWVAIRRRLSPLPQRHLARLPASLQHRHRSWEAERSELTEPALLRRRVRLLALDLRELGVDTACIERHLLRRGIHPALAFETAAWAWSSQPDADSQTPAS